MSDSYYDAIVVGTELAPLCCGALLARRGFRVLLIGQNDVAPSYSLGGHHLQRHPLLCPGLASPVMRRVLQELGLTQSFKRMASEPRVPFQVAMPMHRFDVPRDEKRLDEELEREFPKVKRPIEDFHRHAALLSRRLDPLLARDMVWPAERFLERQQFARLRQGAGLQGRDEMPDTLAELPETHAFRRIVFAVTRFIDGVDSPEPPTLRLLHLYNTLYARTTRLQGGQQALRDLLLDRIRAHSGESRLEERAAQILVRRGHAVGVRLFGSGEEIGSNFVAAGIDLHALLRLLPDRATFEDIFERIGEPQLQRYRYTLNLLVRRPGIPSGMGRDLFFLPEGEGGPDAAPLHVQRTDLDDTHCQLCVERHLPARSVEHGDDYLALTRKGVLASLRTLMPFLDAHLVAIDSPHDGQPPVFVDSPPATPATPGGRRGPQTMPALYGYPVTRALDLCALPVRTPIRHLMLCNRQVAPGLGLEGEVLAAASAARAISQADRSKQWMRTGLRSKVDL